MKTVVVIGAGKGMGNAIARRFAREGFKAVLVARRREALEAAVAELAKDGLEASCETADASDANSLAEAIDRIGTPDVLVYNAAFMAGGKASELTPDEMVAHFKTDVVGAQVAAKCVIPAMRERGAGAIIFTGGLFGVHPSADANFACMSMDKSALRALALMLNSELKDTAYSRALSTSWALSVPKNASPRNACPTPTGNFIPNALTLRSAIRSDNSRKE